MGDNYDYHFSDIHDLIVTFRQYNSSPVFHQYTMIIEEQRDNLRNHLAEANIPSMIYYPIPLHLQKAYAYLGHKQGDFPNSEYLANHVLSLPIHTELDQDQLNFISKALESFFNGID